MAQTRDASCKSRSCFLKKKKSPEEVNSTILEMSLLCCCFAISPLWLNREIYFLHLILLLTAVETFTFDCINNIYINYLVNVTPILYGDNELFYLTYTDVKQPSRTAITYFLVRRFKAFITLMHLCSFSQACWMWYSAILLKAPF